LKNNGRIYLRACLVLIGMATLGSGYAMGLRSFVALPVEKNGAVIRFTLERVRDADSSVLQTSAAYGLDANQTLLLGLPYRVTSGGKDRIGDFSLLYRYIAWRKDSYSGTDRLGLLGGAVVASDSDRDSAIQVGLVYTHFKNRHEIDGDILYQAGIDDRIDTARYDLSWQYRLSPANRPDWGLPAELYGVLELNGRWLDDEDVIHQVTAGLQWIHQKLVIEGGIVKDIRNGDESRVILGTRFHF
jgi:hypothetical protein